MFCDGPESSHCIKVERDEEEREACRERDSDCVVDCSQVQSTESIRFGSNDSTSTVPEPNASLMMKPLILH